MLLKLNDIKKKKNWEATMRCLGQGKLSMEVCCCRIIIIITLSKRVQLKNPEKNSKGIEGAQDVLIIRHGNGEIVIVRQQLLFDV